ncbi:3'-5' exoribonuclease YhaM family protein [Aminipila sp.]|uniref:3'-5' exoribonuclease YhaM family protein n=1 Tax=Aminipila sp. TaxID=2060095 RepID=UPI0028A1A596|nr:HD domain-containing protein [Aminipila sp.]
MKEFYIADFKTDEEITDFFIIKTIALKLGSNKKQYLDLLVADSTGEVTAKKWDISDSELPSINEIKDGDIVKIKAVVTQWNGLKQLRVMKVRKKVDNDPIELMDLIKAAPERAEDMYEYIYKRAEDMEDKHLKAICIKLLNENKERLMYYPAAQKNHHAQLAGLLYHIKRMLMNGERMCQVYTNVNADLVAAGVILHDMEKLNEIDSNELGISTGYSFEGQLLGHLVQGIKSIEKVAEEIGMPKEKTIMLEHMILTHHYEPEFGSPKKPMFPEAEILHYLDIIDARMFDMADALQGVQPGEFSDRVWTLDNRKIYKPLGE